MSRLGLQAQTGPRIVVWWRFKALIRGRGLSAVTVQSERAQRRSSRSEVTYRDQAGWVYDPARLISIRFATQSALAPADFTMPQWGAERLLSAFSIVALVIALILGLAGCGSAETPLVEGVTPMAVEATPTTVEAASPTPTTVPTPEQPLAARVNGQPIFLADYEKQVTQFEAALSDQERDLNSEEGQAALAQVRRQVLEAMINQLLIEQAAAREGIATSDEEVETHIQADIQAIGDEGKFDQWLADNNLTREDYKAILRSELIYGAMFERVTAAVPTSAEQVHVRYILLESEEEARNVLAQLQAGGDFAALVQEFSRDESTRESGGDRGWFPQGLDLMPPEVEAAAFALEVGQTSEMIASQFGYYILQLLERDPDRPLSPEMQQSLREQTFARWLEEQRAAATIERFVETG